MPGKFKSAWIIDGQHRLFGYFHEKTDPKYRTRAQIPVLAFAGLDHEDEARLFLDINNKQVKVRRDLLWEVNSELNMDSSDPVANINAIITAIALRLGKERMSPLFDHVKSEQAKAGKAFVDLPQIITALKRSNLVGTPDSRAKQISPGVLYDNDKSPSTITRSVNVLSAYLTLFSEGAKEHWNSKNTRNTPDQPGGFLCTTAGIGTLILLLGNLTKDLKDMYDHDFRKMTPADFIAVIEPLCQPVIRYFHHPTFDEVKRFRLLRGSTAMANGMREMQSLIQENHPEYRPAGLEDDIAEQEKMLLVRLNEIYRPLESDLLDTILTQLKTKYRAAEEDWFWKGVPPNVRLSVMEERNKRPSKTTEECFSMPTDGKDIVTHSPTTEMFRSLFEVGDFKWYDKLINLRIGISHTPYQIEDDYESFLEETIGPIVEKGKANLGTLN